MSKDKDRRLTPEEKKLWKLVTQSARPLHSDKITSPVRGEVGALAPGGGKSEHNTYPLPILPSPLPNPPPERGRGNLVLGNYANIDRSTAERFRKGEYPFDATLDLHGMTRDKAYGALMRFIQSHAKRGSRALLIVTGKGSSERPGVLKESLPQWLAGDDLRPFILALDAAKAKHGGSGAYYVLLRRKRPQ